MVNVKVIKSLILFFLIMVFFVEPCFALKRVVLETTKEAIVEKYLKNQSLDTIEGIWSFTVNGHYGEVAIIKNKFQEYTGWDYVGVLVNAEGFGKVGEAKVILKKTAAQGIYTGSYVVQYKGLWGIQQDEATNFVMSSPNILEVKVPAIGHVNFVRIDTFNISGVGVVGGNSSGTGFFITQNLVITNYHVIADAKRVEIMFQNDYTLSARVLGKDESNDIAILLVEGLESKVKPLIIGWTNNMKEGEKVYTVGFPLSNDLSTRPKISDGMINGITGLKDDPTVFQISIPIQPGNSGGPLLASDGRVIGITSSGLNSVYYLRKTGTVPQNVNFAIKADYIMPLVDVAGVALERKDRQEKTFDPVTMMEMAKNAVVYVKAYRE